MISGQSGGNTKNTDAFLQSILRGNPYSGLEPLAQQGVDALSAGTPVSSGLASQSWYYEIESKAGSVTIWWCNRDIENGFPVVIGLQYGHATGTGGWVEGEDFINPSLKPIMDAIADKVWKEVQNA